jgi:hypothetical protein
VVDVNAVIGAAFGALLGLGLATTALGFSGVGPNLEHAHHRIAGRLRSDRLLLRVALAVSAGSLALAVTGWPVGAVLAAAGGVGGPSLHGTRARRTAAIARTEAIAAWAEMVRDTLAAARGLQEAILATAKIAPEPIRAEVRTLAARMERERFAPALRAFAADLADPAGDVVVAALLLTADQHARNLGDVLGAAASSARATASMRIRVEAGRARTYTSSRLIVTVTSVFAGGLLLFNRGYMAPFGTAVGQLVLLVIGGLFAVAVGAMARLGRAEQPHRVLAAVTGEAQR